MQRPWRTHPEPHSNIEFSPKTLDWIWWWDDHDHDHDHEDEDDVWDKPNSRAWSGYHPPTHICALELFCEGFLQESWFLWRPRPDRTFIFCVKDHFLSSQVYLVQFKVLPRDGAAYFGSRNRDWWMNRRRQKCPYKNITTFLSVFKL